MPKSHAQSDTILRRFTGGTATPLTTTYVNLLTTMPTFSNPTGWVEWRSATDTPIVRKVVNIDGATEPYWSEPFVDSNLKYIKNIGLVIWSDTETQTLLDGSQTVLGVGVFTTASTTYSSGVPTDLTDLIYWQELPSSLTFTNEEAVVFLDGNLKVTEQ